jgi:hypothetical protein
MSSIEESLAAAMHLPDDSDTMRWLHDKGMAVADHETMSQAIHDVYCGVLSDHNHPSDKDREQARLLLAALQKHATASGASN